MTYSHCGKCRGLVLDTDHTCRICNRPLDRAADRAAERLVGAVPVAPQLSARPMSQTAPGRPGRRRPPHQLESFLRGAARPGGPLPLPGADDAPGEPRGPVVDTGSGPSEPLRATFLSSPPPSSFDRSGTADVARGRRPDDDLVPPAIAAADPVPDVAHDPAAHPAADAVRTAATRPVPAPPPARARAIVVEGLRKTYGEGELAVAAVRDVGFEVHEGEVVLIMGPSGSGKTTLLLMLGAMLRPTSGSVVIGGTAVSGVPERQLPKVRAKHLGFIFQDFNLLSALTAQENVELACNLAGVRGRRAAGRASALLDRVGLGHRLHFRPNQLSGGEKQRVAVARALANDPPLLLADEPTANLDSAHGRAIGQLLRRLADEDGRTSLIVTHDDRLTDIADRVLWLEDGTLRDAGPHGHAAPADEAATAGAATRRDRS